MSITVCAFIKKENNYIDEWLSHHLSIGVDKFIIYDNNDGREDYPMTEYVSQQVMAKKVKIYNRRNEHLDKKTELKKLYEMCNTDWMILLGIDEFIKLNNRVTINEWLSQEKFSDITNIKISVRSFNDNELIYCNDNHNVISRFNQISFKKNPFNHCSKTIMRTHVDDIIDISDFGLKAPNIKTVYCDGNFTSINITDFALEDFSEIEIDAYPTKSLEEYCFIKVGRNLEYDEAKVKRYKEKYFEINNKTSKKEQMFDYFISKIYKNETTKRVLHSYAEFNFGNG